MEYAVNDEGIAALKALSGRLRENTAGISKAADALESALEANRHALGPHAAAIANVIAEMRHAHQDACVPIAELSEKVDDLAGEYQEFVNTNRFASSGGSGSAAGGVSSGGAGAGGGVGGTSNSTQSISGWIKTINPNYNSPFFPVRNPYRVNCGSCALAVEARLNGDTTAVAGATNVGTDAGMEQATGKKCQYMTVQEIERVIKERGAGSHFIVGINRHPTPSGKRQSGHWFNVFFDGDKISTIEGQSGNIYGWPHDYGDISEWCILI